METFEKILSECRKIRTHPVHLYHDVLTSLVRKGSTCSARDFFFKENPEISLENPVAIWQKYQEAVRAGEFHKTLEEFIEALVKQALSPSVERLLEQGMPQPEIMGKFSIAYKSFIVSTISLYDFNQAVHPHTADVARDALMEMTELSQATLIAHVITNNIKLSVNDIADALHRNRDVLTSPAFIEGQMLEDQLISNYPSYLLLLLCKRTLGNEEFLQIQDAWCRYPGWAGINNLLMRNHFDGYWSELDQSGDMFNVFDGEMRKSILTPCNVTPDSPEYERGLASYVFDPADVLFDKHSLVSYGHDISVWLGSDDGPRRYGLLTGQKPKSIFVKTDKGAISKMFDNLLPW